MQHHQVKKLENPARIQELDAVQTLTRIGLGDNLVVADVGAGSGVFALPAARLTTGKVYVLEINDEMLAVVGQKAENQDINNIELIKVEGGYLNLPDHSTDIVLLVTVMHEISDHSQMLSEVKRIMKDTGRFAIVEFHKRNTPMGPPLERRLSKESVQGELQNFGFALVDDFDLGENMYCLVFEV